MSGPSEPSGRAQARGALPVHVPILTRPIVEALVSGIAGESPVLVDCTFGGGGHTRALLDALLEKAPAARVLALDQDPNAIARGQEIFAEEIARGRLELQHLRFSECEELLHSRNVRGLIADLGFSSDQLEDADRGLSFQLEGPLDMRLDPTRGVPALQFLRQVTENELKEVIGELGEERFAGRIAGAIVRKRRERELPTTTTGLADLIRSAVPAAARHGRIHPATRTFQALRIHINGELKELDQLLGRVIIEVRPGGRVAIISFHSLEDRKVKQAFRAGPFRALTKKPIEADERELKENPRSRSAKLRIAERVAEGER